MNWGSPSTGESLIDVYCSQLGTMLDRRTPGLALVFAKRQAETTAVLANREMLQAQASDRAKTKFLANMSHELRTPLNAIIGFSEVIKLDAPQPRERYPEYAKYIHEAAVHLLEVINGILDLARIEAGKVELEEAFVSVSRLVDSAVSTIRPLADKKLVDLKCQSDAAAPVVLVDQTKLKQVLFNVLSNAVKFTRSGGCVAVAWARDGSGDLVIAVSDTGVGIPPDQLAKVFEPFEQVEDHLTRQNEGTGLGLPIAKALLELHGGRLVLHSEIDRGTTAELYLPGYRVGVSEASADA